MAGRKIGEAFVRLRPDTGGFKQEMQMSGHEAGEGFASSMTKRIASVFAGVAVFDFLKGSVEQATESAVVARATEAVIKSTGGAAGITAEQIGKLSTKLSNLSGVDDELIQHGENVLLTFTNIKNAAGEGNDVFDQASLATLNLSTALKTDLQSASILVGKALNDPIKGVTALRRAGVQLSDEQVEQVKHFTEVGDVMSAQKIILGELSKEFGGAAEAAATPAAKASVAWGNFQEMIGGLILPAVGKLAEVFTGTVLPAVQTAVDLFTGGWSNGVREGAGFMEQFGAIAHEVFTVTWDVLEHKVWPVIKNVVIALHDLIGWVNRGSTGAQVFRAVVIGLTAAFLAYKIAMTAIAVATEIAAAGQWLLNIAMDANPIGLIILAIIALVAGIWYLWTHSEAFRNFFIGLWDSIWGFLKAVGAWFAGPFADFFKKAWANLQESLAIIVAIFKAYWQLIVDVVSAVVGWIEDRISTGIANIKAIINRIIDIVQFWINVFDGIKSAVSNGIDAVIGWFAGLPGRIWNAVGDLGSLLWNAGQDVVRGLWNGIAGMGNWLAGQVSGFINRYVPGPVRHLLGIESPSKLFAELGRDTVRGFAVGFGDQSRRLEGDLNLPLPGAPQLAGAGAGLAGMVQQLVAAAGTGNADQLGLLQRIADLLAALDLKVGPDGLALAVRAGEKQLSYAGGAA